MINIKNRTDSCFSHHITASDTAALLPMLVHRKQWDLGKNLVYFYLVGDKSSPIALRTIKVNKTYITVVHMELIRHINAQRRGPHSPVICHLSVSANNQALLNRKKHAWDPVSLFFFPRSWNGKGFIKVILSTFPYPKMVYMLWKWE